MQLSGCWCSVCVWRHQEVKVNTFNKTKRQKSKTITPQGKTGNTQKILDIISVIMCSCHLSAPMLPGDTQLTLPSRKCFTRLSGLNRARAQ